MSITGFKNESVYIVVEWPEVQDLMEASWFQEEAILDVDCKINGNSSTYLVPAKYLDTSFQ